MRAWSLLLLALLAGCSRSANDHLRAARDAIYEKKSDQALAEYRLALDALERDGSPEAQVLRARALRGAADTYYLELRDFKRAVEVYRELIKECPESPEALDGRIFLSEILRRHFRDYRGAISELKAALARNPPQGAELTYEVARLYFELGDYQQCALEAQELVKRYETSVYVDEALFLRGQALSMMEGRRAEALHAFTELAERYPDTEWAPHAQFELGKILSESGDNERAIAAWVKALRQHPQPEVVQSAIARVRKRVVATTPKKLGDAEEAFDHWKYGNEGASRGAVVVRPPRNSIEAVGGSAEEAAREARMGADQQSSPPPSGPAP